MNQKKKKELGFQKVRETRETLLQIVLYFKIVPWGLFENKQTNKKIQANRLWFSSSVINM